MPTARTIVVTGDFLVDHHIYEGFRLHFTDQDRPGVTVKTELGGAALVHRAIQALAEQLGSGVESHLAVDESAALAARLSAGSPTATESHEAYAFWKPMGKAGDVFWKVQQSMGFGGTAASQNMWPWPDARDIPANPTVLAIAEGGMGFRSRMQSSRWRIPVVDAQLKGLRPAAETALPVEPSWIVLKPSAPIAQGDLWRELSSAHAGRLITVVSSSELRRGGVRLGLGLSWEQTLEELHRELDVSPALASLARSRHLIVSFGTEGAILLTTSDGQREATFLFDPDHVEGGHRASIHGDAYGLLSCLAATAALAAAENPESPDLKTALQRGLVAMSCLLKQGHGPAKATPAGFPSKALAEAVKNPGSLAVQKSVSYNCSSATCPIKPGWSILSLPQAPQACAQQTPLFGLGYRVLTRGLGELRAPTLKIGAFLSADRGEIEALRSLEILVRRYDRNDKADKPLSIGVFGPPGAGKSFAVKQLAKHLFADKLGWREFNLSQFRDASDLIGSFHQIRDDILDGKKPVAFFDEFDSQQFQWLKYLLAPMQDGRFQDGQLTHPLGRCVFIFAGGTSASYDEFATKKDDGFRLAKGPDFASRLDGVLNVVGPNPRNASKAAGQPDIFYPVRRAVFIRANLNFGKNEPMTVDPALATALLELPHYKNGARSLAKMLEPFAVARRTADSASARTMRPADLLPEDQLALYVDKNTFDALMRRERDAASALGTDVLAAAVHAYYRAEGLKGNWIKPQHDCEFKDLSPFDQDSNRAAARRIPMVLAMIGLTVVKGSATATEEKPVLALLDFHKDALGEAEHDFWSDWHMTNGWRYSEIRDDANMRHDCLLPFHELAEKQKKKDRDAVLAYPDIVKLAGMKIVERS